MTTTKPIQQRLFPSTDTPQPPPQGSFAQIVFDRPLDQAYTYRIPDELLESISIGKRVEAPFGRGNRRAVGFCVGLSEEPPTHAVKDVSGIIDDKPLLTENLLRLTRWMADYYLCSWGQVLKAVVPAAAKKQAGTKAAAFVEAVAEEKLPDDAPKLTKKQEAILGKLRRQDRPVEMRRFAKLAGCTTKLLESLINKGFARKSVKRVDTEQSQPTFDDETPEHATAPEIRLNADQQAALEALLDAVRHPEFRPYLLYGVTGSGKTELYLRAMEEVLSQGKQALILVPEISLTPQTIQRFRGRCEQVAVLHSHLREAERGNHWRRIRDGQVQVIVGARSAIFAPTDRLGLIVIDEEHESSFKQESTPRYNARDVAVMRARIENIPIILGSATPSLESWHNAQRGQYTLLTLPQRVMDRPLPKVACVDLRHDMPRGKRFQAISPMLQQAMNKALLQGGQVILLLNRRGFNTHVHCPGCGNVESCKFCDLAMTYHQHRDINLCHFCGFQQTPPQLCPKCNKVNLRYQGLGTEKLESEIEKKFPGYIVRRMDSDTMKKPGSHAKLLNAVRRGEVHILMGTQMIAKGLDFPNVTLVGVVYADVALHLPDFRAAERTFQLLSQVAGRAGRGQRGGQVLIQTYTPDHPAIKLAAKHDFLQFAEGEMAHRRDFQYPPYQRLVRVIVRSRKQENAERFAEYLSRSLQDSLKTVKPLNDQPIDVRILGPAECAVFRLKGHYRFHLQLQSVSAGLLHQVLRDVIGKMRTPDGVEYSVDVDPLNML